MRRMMLGALAVLLGCGGGETVVRSSCTPGSTQVCVCDDGRSGAQSCTATGAGFDACRCADAGVQQISDVPQTSDVVAVIDSSGPRCGDGICNGESCASCPADCGGCDGGFRPDTGPSDPCASATDCASCTPRAGCGWCGASSRCVAVNASCTGPLGGSCGSGWACQPTDCPTSTACLPCAADGDCLSGACGTRRCDGARVCIPMGRPATCTTVSGLACPAVSIYHACTSDVQCGPRMRCAPVYPGETDRVCALPCTTDDDCPAPAGGGASINYCASTDHVCHLGCMASGICDSTGLTCRRSISGTYAFCL